MKSPVILILRSYTIQLNKLFYYLFFEPRILRILISIAKKTLLYEHEMYVLLVSTLEIKIE